MAVKKLRRFAIACLFLLVVCAWMPVNTSAQSGNYSFVNIDYPQSNTISQPLGINDKGQIVGWWQDLSTGALHGYFYDGSTYTTLDYPGGGNTEAVGINNNGVISGLYYTSNSGPYGFIYDNGTFTQLSYPGSPSADGQGINNHDDVVGFYGNYYSFVYANGGYTSFGYPGAEVTFGHGINDSGLIAGHYQLVNAGEPYGFFDNGGTFTSIDYPDSYENFAYGINNSNVVVGYAALNSTGASVGFLWQAGQFTLINPSDWGALPYGINNSGQLVGVYFPSGDYHGFLATPSASPPLQFNPVLPCRVVDTRNPNGPFGGPPIPGGTARSFPLPQGVCNIPTTAAAYSLNVTVVPSGQLGYLTIWPTGQSQPVVSTMNSLDGRIKANAAIVPAGTNEAVSVYVSNTTNVVLDIDGYFTTPGSFTQAFYPLTPCRVLDTRNANGPLGGPFLSGGQERDFPVLSSDCKIPSNAEAYSMNFTVVPVQGQPLGYLTVWPESLQRPSVSTLNDLTATIVANAAIVPAGTGGGIATYADQNTQLVADINGYFAAPGTGGLSLYTVAPCRVIDTRKVGNGQPFSGELTVNVAGSSCAPSSTAQAYVFNATVVPTGGLGYLTLWPDSQKQPVVSTLNAIDGAITSNMAIVPTNNGKVDAYASGITQLILDLSSYFAP